MYTGPESERPWWGGALLVGIATFLLWAAGPGRPVVENIAAGISGK